MAGGVRVFLGLETEQKWGLEHQNHDYKGSAAKAKLFWPFLVQNDIVLDVTRFFLNPADIPKRRRFGHWQS